MTATTTSICFTVNGETVEVVAPGGRRLLDTLRTDLGLTGTKEGCGEGECGACSVLLDGELVNSCLVPLCQVDGHAVATVEGLATDGRLDPLQAAFLRTGGAQCGICTPGMLMAGRAFLDSAAAPTDEAIRGAIAGNLCRCTGYMKIVEAIRLAASGPAAAEPAEAGLAAAEPAEAGLAAAEPAEAGLAAAELPAELVAAHLPTPGATAEPRAGTSPTPAVPGATGVIVRAAPPTVSPQTLADALRLLAEVPCRPIAGGTDVMVALAADGQEEARPLLDLWALDELRGIRLVADAADRPDRPGTPTLVLGALTTYADLLRSRLIAEHLPVLAETAATVGAAQIQARGTIGGNIANASPAGDMLPVLLATDAMLVAASVRGERRIPAAGFFLAYRRTALATDELLVRVEIPLPPGRRVRYRKIGTRRAQAISKVVMAVAWRPDGDAWRDVRVALGSVAPVPIRAPHTEAVLEGASPTPEVAEHAGATVAGEIRPIDDVRSTAAYRRAVAGRALRRIVLDAGAR